jgi:hypothetical protein
MNQLRLHRPGRGRIKGNWRVADLLEVAIGPAEFLEVENPAGFLYFRTSSSTSWGSRSRTRRTCPPQRPTFARRALTAWPS